jgi:hypothetical protein
MTHPTHRLDHVTATASDWGLSKPKEIGEDERKRPLAAVATDLNARLSNAAGPPIPRLARRSRCAAT